MSQDSNTTSDTSGQPRLKIRRSDEPPAPDKPAAAAPGPAAASTPAVPRLTFAPKKRAEESTAAPDAAPTPLKRPPQGTPLTPSTPMTPAGSPAAVTPLRAPATPPAKKKRRPLLSLIGVTVASVGAMAAYIFWPDEAPDQVGGQMPPMAAKFAASNAPPIEVTATVGTAPTPAAAYLQTFNPGIAAGGRPRLIVGARTFHLNEIVAAEFGLRWTRINDQTRELEFTDNQGQRYIKKF